MTKLSTLLYHCNQHKIASNEGMNYKLHLEKSVFRLLTFWENIVHSSYLIHSQVIDKNKKNRNICDFFSTLYVPSISGVLYTTYFYRIRGSLSY